MFLREGLCHGRTCRGGGWGCSGCGRREKWGTRRKGIFTGATCHRSCLRPRRRTHTADTLTRLGPLVRRSFFYNTRTRARAHRLHAVMCIMKYVRVVHSAMRVYNTHVTAVYSEMGCDLWIYSCFIERLKDHRRGIGNNIMSADVWSGDSENEMLICNESRTNYYFSIFFAPYTIIINGLILLTTRLKLKMSSDVGLYYFFHFIRFRESLARCHNIDNYWGVVTCIFNYVFGIIIMYRLKNIRIRIHFIPIFILQVFYHVIVRYV